MTKIKRRSPNAKYDWEKWFKEKRFVLKKGIHYDCEPFSMMLLARRAAIRLGLHKPLRLRAKRKHRNGKYVTITMEGNSIIVSRKVA